MQLQSFRKTYSDSALREGIQCSLRGAPADVVHNMGPNVPLDMILKKFTIIYGNVKIIRLVDKVIFTGQIKGRKKASSPLLLG